MSTLYCEVCGRPIEGPGHRVLLDGVEVVLCDDCFIKLSRSGRVMPVPKRQAQVPQVRPKAARRPSNSTMLEVVDDYPDIIRRARESRGWTQAALAQRLRISEDLLRKIESGKLKPPVDLARRIEGLLKVQLLQPVEYEEGEPGSPESSLTFGDVAVVRKESHKGLGPRE